jgi:hypothetical protein
VIPASPCCATTPRSTKDWVTSPKHFWRVLPKSLPLPSKRAGEAIRWFASKLKPQVDYDLADQILGITLGTSEKPETKGLALLTDVLNIIDRMAAAAGRRGAVILDEFQQIIEEGGATAERQIRGTVQTSTVIFSVRASCLHISRCCCRSRTRQHHCKKSYCRRMQQRLSFLYCKHDSSKALVWI